MGGVAVIQVAPRKRRPSGRQPGRSGELLCQLGLRKVGAARHGRHASGCYVFPYHR